MCVSVCECVHMCVCTCVCACVCVRCVCLDVLGGVRMSLVQAGIFCIENPSWAILLGGSGGLHLPALPPAVACVKQLFTE